MVKIFLHRVTTHKIQISINDANFIDSQILQTPSFHYMPQSDSSLIKEMSTLLLRFSLHSTIYHKSPSPWDNPWQSALLHYSRNILLLTSLEVSLWFKASLGPRLPFWATAEVVPWLLAPETSDMTQVLPGIQSASLPGLFHSNQGFYFLWVVLYFLCQEFY